MILCVPKVWSSSVPSSVRKWGYDFATNCAQIGIFLNLSAPAAVIPPKVYQRLGPKPNLIYRLKHFAHFSPTATGWSEKFRNLASIFQCGPI